MRRTPSSSSGDITALLADWQAGNAAAAAQVMERTYAELRRVARAQMKRERRAHTLAPTALLHEVYVGLLRRGPGTAASRDAFFRLVCGEMRRRLIDHARRRRADKRGGGFQVEPFSESAAVPVAASEESLHAALDQLETALQTLTREFPRAARVAQLRFLAGCTIEEVATHVGVSTGTVKREWIFARAWLAAAIEAAN